MANLKSPASSSSLSSPPPSSPPSLCVARERESSPATGTQPVAMNDEPHSDFTAVYIHTAKCDICEKRNNSVLQRCGTCTVQFCNRCMEVGDGIHVKNADLDWTDYGAQANSLKRQRKPKLRISNQEDSNVHQVRPTFAMQPSINKVEVQNNQPMAAKKACQRAKVAQAIEGTATKTRSKFKKQKLAAVVPSAPRNAALAAKNDTREEEVNIWSTSTCSTMFDSDDESDDEDNSQHDVQKQAKQGSKDEDNIRSIFQTDPRRRMHLALKFYNMQHLKAKPSVAAASNGPDKPTNKAALDPWTETIEGNKHNIEEEMAQIGRDINALRERARVALSKKHEVDDAIDAACALMSMRTGSRDLYANKSEADEAMDAAHTLMSMRTDVCDFPADKSEAGEAMDVARTLMSMGIEACVFPPDKI
jgi:hypothetical protein